MPGALGAVHGILGAVPGALGILLGTPGAVPGALGAVPDAHGVLPGAKKSAKFAEFGWCYDPQPRFRHSILDDKP